MKILDKLDINIYSIICINHSLLFTGTGIPEGSTAYVLTKEDNDIWIWNANTGRHYSHHNYYCPLQSIGCLINNENVRFEKLNVKNQSLSSPLDTIFPSQVFDTIYPLSDLVMAPKSSKFPPVETSWLQSNRVLHMALDYRRPIQ